MKTRVLNQEEILLKKLIDREFIQLVEPEKLIVLSSLFRIFTCTAKKITIKKFTTSIDSSSEIDASRDVTTSTISKEDRIEWKS